MSRRPFTPAHGAPARALALFLAAALVLPACGGAPPAPAAPPRELPAAGVGSAGGKLLTQLAGGILGDAAGNFLEGLGVFDALGLGSKSDAVINQKLDQIIDKLEVMDAKLDEIRTELGAVSAALADLQTWVELQPKITELNDAATNVETCLSQLRQVAAASDRATPAKQAENDALLHRFALQMSGRERGGVCSLTEFFNTIHGRIIEDPDLPDLSRGVYRLIARAACTARGGKVPFDKVASHFVRFAILQQNSVELIRQAYVALGEPQNAAVELPKLQLLLRDERIQFLRGADDYVLCGPPPLDTSAGELADAIVQQLEGVHRQATAYVVDVVPPFSTFTPILGRLFTSTPPVPLDDVLQGSAGAPAYYGARTTAQLLTPECRGGTGAGFAWAVPQVGAGDVPQVVTGESCTAQVGRYLVREPAAVAFTAGWAIALGPDLNRELFPPGPLDLLNAATLEEETGDQALVLMAHVRGRASGKSLFRIVEDPGNPARVSFTVDLPGAAGPAPLRLGPDAARPFTAAGAGEVAWFERVPFGPARPDRFALRTGGKWLAATAANAVKLADEPFWFDLARAQGGVELGYDDPEPAVPTGAHAGRGVLYVNAQFERAFHGRTRNPQFIDGVDLVQERAGWNHHHWVNGVATDTPNPPSMELWPPCSPPGWWPVLGQFPNSYCSNGGLAYTTYATTIVNGDPLRARRYQVRFAVAATASGAYGGTASQRTGIFCLATYPGGWQDLGRPAADPGGPPSPDVVSEFTIDPGQSRVLSCQVDDGYNWPSKLALTKLELRPCKGLAGEACTPYTPSSVAP